MKFMKSIFLLLAIQISFNSFAYMTPIQFDALDNNGNVDPDELRFSQNNIGRCFSDSTPENVIYVQTTIDGLENETVNRDEVPAIEIVKVNPTAIINTTIQNGRSMAAGVYTLDNRRLYAFKQAGVNIRYTKVNPIPGNQRRKFTSAINGTNIDLRAYTTPASNYNNCPAP